MKPIDEEEYIDDGTVYEILQKKEDSSEILAQDFNYKELNTKFNLLAKEKDIILQACIEKEKANPDIEIIKNALSIIKQYESDFTKLRKIKAKKAVEEEPEKKITYEAIEAEHNTILKITVVAFLLGPIGLLRVSWALAIAVFLFALLTLNIIPEFLISIPFISASLAWFTTKRKNQRKKFYQDGSHIKEPVFIIEEKKSPFKKYNLFLKERKKLWLAVLLSFLFSGVGLFYVSWTYALASLMLMITAYFTFPLALFTIPFISVIFSIFATLETNKEQLTIF